MKISRLSLVFLVLPAIGFFLTRAGDAYAPVSETDGSMHIIIGFKADHIVSIERSAQQRASGPVADDLRVIRGYGLRVEPLMSVPARALQAERERIAASATASLRFPNLNRWARMSVSGSESVEDILAMLRRLPSVDTAYIQPRARPAGFIDAQPARVKSFVRDQGYLESAPDGVGAKQAWRKGKAKGQGVTVADVEGDWNARHHDLRSAKQFNIAGVRIGTSLWFDHGTAELGLVIGTRNRYGVTGIAYNADLLMFSIFRREPDGEIFENTADAIMLAAMTLEPGDVMYMPIEFSDSFSGGRGFAVEYFDDVFEAIQAAAAKGIIVVEAAGNGGMNLDGAIFEDHFDRSKRGDSGAIVVGAGGAPGERDLRKLSFSNYGDRVDVQGWGTAVVTTGYGDLFSKGLNREYTASFNGTSSATGIVAGVCAALQSYAKRTLGRPLTPLEMREILVETGTAQKGPSKRRIGPRPDLEAAIAAVDRLR